MAKKCYYLINYYYIFLICTLAFFDECVDHRQDRYLELEFPDTDRTVFIMPPDTSGLSPSVKEYKYETFEDLNPGKILL